MSSEELLRVVMLVNNGRNDSRVVRAAEALSSVGFDVKVVCRNQGSEASIERHGNVDYHCIPYSSAFAKTILRAFVLHLRVLWLATRKSRGIERARRSVHLLTALGLVLLGGMAAPLMVALWPMFRLLGRARVIGVPLRRFSAAITRFAQPATYLDEYAVSCLDVVEKLEPAFIHAHDLATLSAGALASRRTGAVLVYDAHELETHTNYHSLTRRTRRWISRYERWLIALTHASVTVCDSIADFLRAEYGIDRPIVVMNSPQDGTGGNPSARDLRTVLGLDSGKPLAVYVGLVTVDRGMEICVEALAHDPALHFATVGPRDPATEHRMLEIASRIGVADRLHLVDPVPAPDVVSFVSTADCSVIAIQNVCLSYNFCFPNKLLESVFGGLPVAVASLVEMRRFIDKTGVGVVMDETDPRAIAAAIRLLIAGKERYRPTPGLLSEIRAEYGWPAQEAKLRELYRRLRSSQAVTRPDAVGKGLSAG